MPETTPSVSVIIPAHNAGPFIRQAVESALHQTQPPSEVIVVNDGSTDDTEDLLSSYMHHIRYEAYARRGVSAARNAGLALAKGEFVAFLDADDYFLPDKLKAQAAVLAQHEPVHIVHSGWQEVDERGSVVHSVEPWRDAPVLDLRHWLLWKPVFLGAMLLRRESLTRVGGFAADLSQAEDVDLVLRMALAGSKAVWVKRPTVCKRFHQSNLTLGSLAQAEAITEVLRRFFAHGNVPSGIGRMERTVWYYTLVWAAWQLQQGGHDDEASQYIARSISYSKAPPELAVLQVMLQFRIHTRRAAEAGFDPQPLSAVIRRVVDHKPPGYERMDLALDWWEQVWSPFFQGNFDKARQGLQRFTLLRPRVVAKLLQYCLIAEDQETEPELVAGLWSEFVRLTSMPEKDQANAVTLQLTCLAQSVRQKRWGAGLRALRLAAGQRLNWTAAKAWLRFFRAALAHYAPWSATSP